MAFPQLRGIEGQLYEGHTGSVYSLPSAVKHGQSAKIRDCGVSSHWTKLQAGVKMVEDGGGTSADSVPQSHHRKP